MKYEYMIIDDRKDGGPDNRYELNEIGNGGWQLCVVREMYDGSTKWYFKRPIEDSK